jgi:YidC/Oxa1 family membrane protein insertase
LSTEKRALLATALSLLVLMAWQYWLAPRPASAPEGAKPPAAGASPAPAPAGPEPDAPPAAVPSSPAVSGGREQIFVLESRTARVKLSSVGARVLSWRLLAYTDDEGHPLELVPEHAAAAQVPPLGMVAPGDPERTRRLNTATYACDEPRREAHGVSLTCRWSDGRADSVQKTLSLPEDGYLADLEVRAAGGAAAPLVAWSPGLVRDEGPARFGGPAAALQVVLGGAEGVERLPAGKAGEWQDRLEEANWAGVENHYFAAVFVPEEGRGRFARHGRVRQEQRPGAVAAAWAAGGAGRAKLFVGPKSYEMLTRLDAEHGAGLSRLIDFGYFEFLVIPMFLFLKWLQRHLGNFGVAIIVLTVLIKLLFYPVTQRSMVSMRRLQTKMKKMQPKMQHLKELYARKEKSIENRRRMNEEMMELYRREGVNPMSSMTGCLPLLLQIPILWALYALLSAAIELRRAPFLYLDDLSAPDPIYLTPIIMGATMWLQQRLSGTAAPDAAQRWMLNFMPVLMTFMFKDFPSGLVLYWLVNNVLGIAQQFLINRQAAALDSTAAAPPAKRT